LDCADTNSWIAYLAGASGPDVDRIEEGLAGRFLVMAPVVLAELLSDPNLPSEAAQFFQEIPLLALSEGYWARAGKLRARLTGLGHKPKLADTLVAQSCLDHDALLLSLDRDFRPFVKHAQLKLFPRSTE
jgi:predicted nucleic acid-binding protein